MTPTLPLQRLETYRSERFRLRTDLRLKTREDALAFVNELGFVYFWPIKGIIFPSLWSAVAGNRPVANDHDDPGHVTWGWKDEMLDKKLWYYGKILRKKATMISLDVAPYFYALSENYGQPEEDYLIQFEDGLLSREAKLLFEVILADGPIDTVHLRRKAGMTSKASNSSFDRALVQLQRDFKILPVGVAQEGGWRYSFVYDAVHRHFPQLPEQARVIGRREAQSFLMRRYFETMGAASTAEARKLFQWKRRDIDQTLTRLAEAGDIVGEVETQPDGQTVWVTRSLAAELA